MLLNKLNQILISHNQKKLKHLTNQIHKKRCLDKIQNKYSNMKKSNEIKNSLKNKKLKKMTNQNCRIKSTC